MTDYLSLHGDDLLFRISFNVNCFIQMEDCVGVSTVKCKYDSNLSKLIIYTHLGPTCVQFFYINFFCLTP